MEAKAIASSVTFSDKGRRDVALCFIYGLLNPFFGQKNGDTTVTLASPVYKFKNILFHYCLDRLGDTACSSKTHEIESACNVDTKAAA